MPFTLTWGDIAVRLACTLIAGILVGADRGERGKAAGIRTNVLVCLAASLSMILANGMLGTAGKNSSSFAQLDMMRLPLGILSGMGFIGAGAILRKGEMVVGVTTAATLWVVTVIGLCFGGGQLILGAATTVLAVFTLWILRWIDRIIPREHRARLVVTSEASWDVLESLPSLLRAMDCDARFRQRDFDATSQKVDYQFELSWRQPETLPPPPELLSHIDGQFRIKSFELITDNGR